jgi:hypothetical protein
MLADVEARRRALPLLIETESRLVLRADEKRRLVRQREQDYHDAWAEFFPLARGAETKTCGISVDSEVLDKPEARLALWQAVQQCAADGKLPRLAAARARALAQNATSFPVTFRRARAADEDLKQAEAQLERQRSLVNAARALSPQETKALDSFNETSVLRRGWITGGGFLVAFPPPMLQILLSAFSGAFGALLIILVLIVYPKTHLELTSSADYGARMLLGGLIAVCVYIVLRGGTAVLGTSGGFDEAGSNYMTFCAVSVLAGMFSDRVASWLSDRANVFFKSEERDDQGARQNG